MSSTAPGNGKNYDDMLDTISCKHVESDFRRLGGRLYSVDSLQALLKYGLPKKAGTDTRKYFEFKAGNTSAPQRFYKFENWRINPWFKLGKDELSHHHVTTVERAIATELPIAEVALLKTQARNRQNNSPINLPGVPVIDLSSGSNADPQSKPKPAESKENLVLLATVKSLADRRRNSRNQTICLKQEEIKKVIRFKPTHSDEFDLIRVLHSEIQVLEQKEEAVLTKQKSKLQKILLEIDRYAQDRRKHLDNCIWRLQERIDVIH